MDLVAKEKCDNKTWLGGYNVKKFFLMDFIDNDTATGS